MSGSCSCADLLFSVDHECLLGLPAEGYPCTRCRDRATTAGVLRKDLHRPRRRLHDDLRRDADVRGLRDRPRDRVVASTRTERDLLRPNARRHPPVMAVRVRLDHRAVREPQGPGPLNRSRQEVGHAEEAGDEGRRRSLVELLGRAELLDPPAVHHGDRVGHRHRFLLVVRDVDERDPEIVLDALEKQLHLFAKLEVERAEGLVEEEHARSTDESARKGDPLLLAARELPRLAMANARELDEPQHVLHAPFDLILRHSLALQAESDVVEHAQVREQRVRLEDRVHVSLVRRPAYDVTVAEVDVPCVRFLEAADHAQGRRLPAARGTEQREETAVLHLQREVVDRDHVVEALCHVDEADVGRGRLSHRRRPRQTSPRPSRTSASRARGRGSSPSTAPHRRSGCGSSARAGAAGPRKRARRERQTAPP